MKKYIPTIDEVITKYKAIAKLERLKCGKPCEGTVWNTIKGSRNVCRAARLNLDSPITALTRKCIDEALMVFVARGVERISAWTFVSQLRALFARWTLPYYRDAGWTIPPLELPSFRHMAPRYARPGAELLAKVRSWYLSLDGEMWFAATMMLEFAMRNGDVLRLRDERTSSSATARCSSPTLRTRPRSRADAPSSGPSTPTSGRASTTWAAFAAWNFSTRPSPQ